MKEVLFWRNVPILEKLGVEQFNHMIGKGFRKGGILMKQQLFHHFVAGKIQRLLRLIVVDGLINDIGTVDGTAEGAAVDGDGGVADGGVRLGDHAGVGT